MTTEERESYIAELVLITGYSPSAFERFSDEQLEVELERQRDRREMNVR
ncbi:hypothetical protein [Sporosarcina sp. OR05]